MSSANFVNGLLAQRNVLRALFMSPEKAKALANRSKNVATCNSAYRNLLYIANRDKRKLKRASAASKTADSLSAEYHTLQEAIAAQAERLSELYELRSQADDARTECRTTLEVAKFNFDDYLRELEALKLTRVANAFPSAPDAGRYVVDRLLGDKSCLVCGADDGPLITRWVARRNRWGLRCVRRVPGRSGSHNSRRSHRRGTYLSSGRSAVQRSPGIGNRAAGIRNQAIRLRHDSGTNRPTPD